jgi:hypothetical protein
VKRAKRKRAAGYKGAGKTRPPSTFAHSLTQMIPFQPRGSLPQVSAKGLHRSTARSLCANSPPSARLTKKSKKRDSVRSTLRLVICCCCDFLPHHFTAEQKCKCKHLSMYSVASVRIIYIPPLCRQLECS